MKTCKTCKWCDKGRINYGGTNWHDDFRCCKNAPTLEGVPKVRAIDWCGEWEGENHFSQGLVKSITLVVDGETVVFRPDGV